MDSNAETCQEVQNQAVLQELLQKKPKTTPPEKKKTTKELQKDITKFAEPLKQGKDKLADSFLVNDTDFIK